MSLSFSPKRVKQQGSENPCPPYCHTANPLEWLQRPSPRFALPIFDSPIAVVQNLLVHQLLPCPHQRRVIGS